MIPNNKPIQTLKDNKSFDGEQHNLQSDVDTTEQQAPTWTFAQLQAQLQARLPTDLAQYSKHKHIVTKYTRVITVEERQKVLWALTDALVQKWIKAGPVQEIRSSTIKSSSPVITALLILQYTT